MLRMVQILPSENQGGPVADLPKQPQVYEPAMIDHYRSILYFPLNEF